MVDAVALAAIASRISEFAYLPVHAIWAALVVVLFPPPFAYA